MPVIVRYDNINTLLRNPDGPVGRSIDYLGARVQAKARARCPVDTGRLRRSIVATPVRPRGSNTLSIQIGTDVPYAIYVHEGTEDMEPRPFLRDALDQEVR